MRSILIIVLLLFSVGALAAVLPAVGPLDELANPQSQQLEWVRTVDGWERPINWQQPSRTAPGLHPAVVSGFIALASLAALVAFSRSK